MKYTVLMALGVSAAPVEKKLVVPLDHKAKMLGGADFEMRYIVNDEYYNHAMNQHLPRPILFYTGNEQDIWGAY